MPRIFNFEDLIRFFEEPSVVELLKCKLKYKYDDPGIFKDTGVLAFLDLDVAVFRRGNLKEHQKLKYVLEYFRNLYISRLFRGETILQRETIDSFFSLGGKEAPIKVKLNEKFINTCLNHHDIKSLFEYLKKIIFPNKKMQI